MNGKEKWILAGKCLAAIVLGAAAMALSGYLFVPVCDFEQPRTFAGESVYNPYEGVDFGEAKKAILHTHSTRSDGRYTPEEVAAAYRAAGYEIVGISDHHRITATGAANGLRIYEHGFNVHRFHNLVFGAERPDRFQLPLWQGVSGREETLRRLKERFALVVLNHPAGSRRLGQRQLERLSHYDYIEADRSMEWEMPPWDAALSAGHYSFVMAGDDMHDLARPGKLGRAMMFVMTPSVDARAVMKALEAGHTYAVRVARPQDGCGGEMPRVVRMELQGDTLRVGFSMPGTVRFVGQGGRLLGEIKGSREVHYLFADGDTYVRVEAGFDVAGGTTVYLNPVARYSPLEGELVPANTSYSVRNEYATRFYVVGHALLIAAMMLCVFLMFGFRPAIRRFFLPENPANEEAGSRRTQWSI